MATLFSANSSLIPSQLVQPPDRSKIHHPEARFQSSRSEESQTQQGNNFTFQQANPRLNSLEEFPLLSSNSGASSNLHCNNYSKAWKDVITKNNFHKNSIHLQYYEPVTKENIKYAYIDENLILQARKKWQNSIAFYVYGKKPYYKYLKEYIDRSWQIKGGYQLFTRENGFYIIKLDSHEDCDNILARGPYFYNKRLIFMKKWKPGLKLTREFLHSLPIWIQLPNLDLDLWSAEAISRIASVIGNPVKLDQITEDLTRISYARVLVEIDINCQFPAEVPIQCFDGTIIWQKIIYEWIPLVCANCKTFGHSVNNCTAKKVWRQKENSIKEAIMEVEFPIQINNEGNSDITLQKTSNSSQNNMEKYICNQSELVELSGCYSKSKNKGNILDAVDLAPNKFEVLNTLDMEATNRDNEHKESVQADVENIVLNGECLNNGKTMHTKDELNESTPKVPVEVSNTDGEETNVQDINMEDLDSLTASFRKKRNKINLNSCSGNVVIEGEPFVETNPKWNDLVSQLKSRSKNKKAKEDNNFTGGVKSKGITKK